LPHFTQSADVRHRFEREAQAVRQLEHPHIVQALDCGEMGGRYYIVMEYISGPNLGDYMEKHGRLPLVQVSQIVHDVASALH